MDDERHLRAELERERAEHAALRASTKQLMERLIGQLNAATGLDVDDVAASLASAAPNMPPAALDAASDELGVVSTSSALLKWRLFEREFDALNSGEQTMGDLVQQWDYLRSEVVSLRAAILTSLDEKNALASELEQKIVSLAMDKSVLLQAMPGAPVDSSSAQTQLARREAAVLAGQLAEERQRVAALVDQKRTVEERSERLMGDMLAKLRALEAAQAARSLPADADAASAGEEAAALRARIKAVESQTASLQAERAVLEQQLYREKQQRFEDVNWRLAADAERHELQANQESQAETLKRLEDEYAAIELLQGRANALSASKGQLTAAVVALTRERDELRVQSQNARAELAETALKVERAEADARRTIRRLEAAANAL